MLISEANTKRRNRPQFPFRREGAYKTIKREKKFEMPISIDQSIKNLDWHKKIGRDGKEFYATQITGADYGVSWDGRINIYSHLHGKPQEWENAWFVDVLLTRRVKIRQDVDANSPNIDTIPVRVALDDQGDEEIAHDRYILLYPTHKDPEGNLSLHQMEMKTTLQGFGRQYGYHIHDNSLWSKSVMGGYRSGRAHIKKVLVIDRPGQEFKAIKIEDNIR